jgi:hypothetical protein
VLVFEPALAVKSSHAARPSSGNRLAIRVVLHITTSKDAFDVCVRGTITGHQVPGIFHVQYVLEDCRVWFVANSNE